MIEFIYTLIIKFTLVKVFDISYKLYISFKSNIILIIYNIERNYN